MTLPGPLLEALTRRLAECPAEFMAEPRLGRRGQVHVAAVVSDVMLALGGHPLTPAQAAGFQAARVKNERNRLRAVLAACWLLHDDWFQKQSGLSEDALEFLHSGLNELAGLTPAPALVTDPDRREELARLCLRALDLHPAGESEAQAQDRLAVLNSAERKRVISAARAAEERAAEIRRAMAEEAARAAEMKGMRE
jgi:hypothetical protein